MEMIRRIREYLIPSDLEIHIYAGKIHVVGFSSIGEIGSEKIIIRHKEGNFVVKGEQLTLSKLCGDEVLIRGIVKQVEFR